MAFHGAFKNALLAVGGTKWSGYANTATLTCSMEELNSTVIGGTARGRMAGLADAELAMSLVWDGAADADAFAAMSATPGSGTAMTFGATATEGARAFLSRTCTYNYRPGASIGDLLVADFSMRAVKSVVAGVVLEPAVAQRNTTGNSGAVLFKACGATETLYATLNVVYIEGSTDSITVKVQSDDGAGFPSPVDRITFSAVTGTAGVGSQWLSLGPGAITDTYYRASWTVTGSPKAIIAVAVGIR